MILVGSLKFSPVFKTHCLAFGKACEKRGFEVEYLFSREYKWMLPEEIRSKSHLVGTSADMMSLLKDSLYPQAWFEAKTILDSRRPSHVYMHNYHFLNHLIAHVTRRNGGKFIYHVHEPFVVNKEMHGGFQRYWLYLFEAFQDRLLRNTDVAILSSEEAEWLFELRYPHYTASRLRVPLMYEDLGEYSSNHSNRKYLTLVGPPVPAKGPEKFLDILKYSREKNLGYEFLLISRKPLQDPIYRQSNLKVFTKERITDEEYGRLIRESIAVITPYRRETQSSVVLVSYMHGTPVLSSNAGGLTESVKHQETGYVLDYDAPTEEWVNGVEYIKRNFGDLSRNCRNYFVNNSSGAQWDRYLHALLK